VRTDANQWLDPGMPPIWKTATPNVGAAAVETEYSATCKYWRYTGLNVRYQGRTGSDDWTVNELDLDDYNNYRKCYGCTVVNAANTVPGSAQATLENYNKGADGNAAFSGWVATGHVKLHASPMIEVKGCNGGPSGQRCPFYEPQDPEYNTGTIFSDLMYGEWWTYIQNTVGQPEYSIQWRSPYSVAALAGCFPDNNTFLSTRKLIQHVSGGIGAIEYADFAEDGSYFKLFSASNENTDTSDEGQCELILGTTRNIPRYGSTAMSATHVGTDLIAYWNLIWNSNFLSMATVEDRSES
jgi:hypothetical protein